ncbi:MAG: HAD family hydrolase [Clostridia bacterium]|nr:HAD family hydrolase [Clostridia bacterium]
MRKITTVLFDLDGTLIRMDQDEFIRLYFVSILGKLGSLGYDTAIMKDALEGAVVATLRNDGKLSNEDRFWQVFDEISGGLSSSVRAEIESYYADEFGSVIAATCEAYPRAREVLETVKEKGLRPILATNPLFPMVATHGRIRLGGMTPEDFEYITAYENSSYCKPNPAYFTELLAKLGISPEECVMIGNDTRDDFSALALGIPVFVLTECLINTRGVDLNDYPHGGFDELIDFIAKL